MTDLTTTHIPVLLAEVTEHLNIRADGTYLDATFGGGGHAKAILALLHPEGTLLALDRNPDTFQIAQQLVQEAVSLGWGRLVFAEANFSELDKIAAKHGMSTLDGVLFDLGLSSDLLISGRGFSFRESSALDMRMDASSEMTAADIVNTFDEAALAQLFREFGEDPRSTRVAAAIVRRRAQTPFRTAQDLAECITQECGPARPGAIHPATRFFQALRIVVNREFYHLDLALQAAVQRLAPGGRLVVITFHSLEDRFVKRFIKKNTGQCVCFEPPDLCRCPRIANLATYTSRPIVPTQAEIQKNPRARSAKMRVAVKI